MGSHFEKRYFINQTPYAGEAILDSGCCSLVGARWSSDAVLADYPIPSYATLLAAVSEGLPWGSSQQQQGNS